VLDGLAPARPPRFVDARQGRVDEVEFDAFRAARGFGPGSRW